MGLEPLLLRAFGTSQGNHFFFGLGTFPANEHRRGVLSNSQSNKIKTQTRVEEIKTDIIIIIIILIKLV